MLNKEKYKTASQLSGANSLTFKYCDKELYLDCVPPHKWENKEQSKKVNKIKKDILKINNKCFYWKSNKGMIVDFVESNPNKKLKVLCFLCYQIKHCDKAGNKNALMLLKSNKSQNVINKNIWKYVLENKKLPQINDILDEFIIVNQTTKYYGEYLKKGRNEGPSSFRTKGNKKILEYKGFPSGRDICNKLGTSDLLNKMILSINEPKNENKKLNDFI